MDVNYGSSEPFTLGVEEELQLVNAESFELTSRYAEVFGEAARSDERIKAELLQSTVEVATKPARTVGEAIAEAGELRRRAHSEADASGIAVISAGTHPFSRYEHQDVTEEQRYADLVERHALAGGVVLDLVAGQASDREVAGAGIGQIDAADRSRRRHRERLGQREPGVVCAEQLEELPFLGVVRTRGIAEGGTDAPKALRQQFLFREVR